MVSNSDIEEYGKYLAQQGKDPAAIKEYQNYLRTQNGLQEGLGSEHPIADTFNKVMGAKPDYQAPKNIEDALKIAPEEADQAYNQALGGFGSGVGAGLLKSGAKYLNPDVVEKGAEFLGHAGGAAVGHTLGGFPGGLIGAKGGGEAGKGAGKWLGGLLRKSAPAAEAIPQALQRVEADVGPTILPDVTKSPVLAAEEAYGTGKGLLQAEPQAGNEMLSQLENYKSKFDFSKDKRGAVEGYLDSLINKVKSTPADQLDPATLTAIKQRLELQKASGQ